MNKYLQTCSNLKNSGMISVREYESGGDEFIIQFNIPSKKRYTYERKGFSSAIAVNHLDLKGRGFLLLRQNVVILHHKRFRSQQASIRPIPDLLFQTI